MRTRCASSCGAASAFKANQSLRRRRFTATATRRKFGHFFLRMLVRVETAQSPPDVQKRRPDDALLVPMTTRRTRRTTTKHMRAPTTTSANRIEFQTRAAAWNGTKIRVAAAETSPPKKRGSGEQKSFVCVAGRQSPTHSRRMRSEGPTAADEGQAKRFPRSAAATRTATRQRPSPLDAFDLSALSRLRLLISVTHRPRPFLAPWKVVWRERCDTAFPCALSPCRSCAFSTALLTAAVSTPPDTLSARFLLSQVRQRTPRIDMRALSAADRRYLLRVE